jgi:hypothetical protein
MNNKFNLGVVKMTINFGVSPPAIVYSPGQTLFELITNDSLRNPFKDLLRLSDYAALARVNKAFQKKIQPIVVEDRDRVLKAIVSGRDKWMNMANIIC